MADTYNTGPEGTGKAAALRTAKLRPGESPIHTRPMDGGGAAICVFLYLIEHRKHGEVCHTFTLRPLGYTVMGPRPTVHELLGNWYVIPGGFSLSPNCWEVFELIHTSGEAVRPMYIKEETVPCFIWRGRIRRLMMLWRHPSDDGPGINDWLTEGVGHE